MAKGEIKYTATHRGTTTTRTSKRAYSHTFWLHISIEAQRERAKRSFEYERQLNRAYFEKLAVHGPQYSWQTEADVEKARAWLAVDVQAELAKIDALYDAEIAKNGGASFWMDSGQFAGSYELADKAARARASGDSTIIGYEIVPVQRS